MGPLFSKLSQVDRCTCRARARLQARGSSSRKRQWRTCRLPHRQLGVVCPVMSIALVVVGVGLYRRRVMGATRDVGWAVTALVLARRQLRSSPWRGCSRTRSSGSTKHMRAQGVTPPFEVAGSPDRTILVAVRPSLYCAVSDVLLVAHRPPLGGERLYGFDASCVSASPVTRQVHQLAMHLGAEPAIELLRVDVPVEHGPLEAAAAVRHGLVGERAHEALADAARRARRDARIDPRDTATAAPGTSSR